MRYDNVLCDGKVSNWFQSYGFVTVSDIYGRKWNLWFGTKECTGKVVQNGGNSACWFSKGCVVRGYFQVRDQGLTMNNVHLVRRHKLNSVRLCTSSNLSNCSFGMRCIFTHCLHTRKQSLRSLYEKRIRHIEQSSPISRKKIKLDPIFICRRKVTLITAVSRRKNTLGTPVSRLKITLRTTVSRRKITHRSTLIPSKLDSTLTPAKQNVVFLYYHTQL